MQLTRLISVRHCLGIANAQKTAGAFLATVSKQRRLSGAGLLQAATVVALAFTSGLLVVGLSRSQSLGLDFAPIWAAASRPSIAYNAFAVTAIQDPLLYGFQGGLRPFAYPPTALLLFLPFGSLSLTIAYSLFATAAFTLLVTAAVRTGSPWWVAIAPPVVLLLLVGQASLLVGGLLLFGMAKPDWRARGATLGLAIAIKPQLCVLIPFLLLFDRDWRGLIAITVTVAVLSIAASIVFGTQVWAQWFGSIETLQEVVRTTSNFRTLVGSPLMAPVSLAAIWLLRWEDGQVRLAAAVGGWLLITPYGMHYELALLMPAVAAAARRLAPMCLIALSLGVLWQVGMPIILLTLGSLLLLRRPLERGMPKRHLPQGATLEPCGSS